MKPGETMRYACGDCQIVFDLTLSPLSERADEGIDCPEDEEPLFCPFCAVDQLRPMHDRAIQIDLKQ